MHRRGWLQRHASPHSRAVRRRVRGAPPRAAMPAPAAAPSPGPARPRSIRSCARRPTRPASRARSGRLRRPEHGCSGVRPPTGRASGRGTGGPPCRATGARPRRCRAPGGRPHPAARRRGGFAAPTRRPSLKGKRSSPVPDSTSIGRGATSAPRSSCSRRPSIPNRICEPHMFHGIRWLSAHEEKYPLTTHAATRRVDGGREEGDGAAVGDADHAEARRVDQRVLLQDVEGAPQVPDVLRQGIPAGHGRMDEVRVAFVVVVGVPIEPFTEAAQVGCQHDVAAPDELQRVVGVGHVGVLQPDDLRLARPVAVAGQDGRPGRLVLPLVGDEQVGGDRHGVLGVEDDLVPAVAVAGLRLERLEVERDRLGLGPEQLGEPGPAPLHPGRERRRVVLGQRVLVGRGGQPGHPLVPGRVIAGRRGQDEAPGVFTHERPFLAVRVVEGQCRRVRRARDRRIPAPRRRHRAGSGTIAP